MPAATEPRPPDFGLDDVLSALRRHPARMAIVFAVVTPLVLLLLRIVPRSYRAEAAVLVTLGHELASTPEGSGATRAAALKLEEIVNSEVEVFKSRDLAADVVGELGADTLYPEIVANAVSPGTAVAAAVDRFQAATTVRAVRTSAVIRVSFEHADPELAARAANLLVEKFTGKQLDVFSGPMSAFAEAQVSGHAQALEEAEGRLEAYRRENDLHDPPEQRRLLLVRRDALDAKLAEAQVGQSELVARRAATDRASLLKDGRVLADATAPDARAVQEAQARLLELELRERTALETHVETSRTVTAIREELATTRRFLAEREQELDAARRGDVAADLAALGARGQGLATEAAAVDAEIERFAATERELHALERAVELAEGQFADAQRRLAETRLAELMSQQRLASVRSVQRAVAPLAPVGPALPVQVLLAVGLGLACAVGSALLAHEPRRAPAGG